MQMYSLPEGFFFRLVEIEVSPETTVHAALLLTNPHWVSILKNTVLMFIQWSQSFLENLFVVVSFYIVAGRHIYKSMYGKHCNA